MRSFKDESHLQTPGAVLTMPFAGMENGFRISTKDGVQVLGYAYNADFPNDVSEETRGELFYIEVPTALRRSGVGTALARDAFRLMKARGCVTVNMSITSSEGRALVARLLREGDIVGPIRNSNTGKAEYQFP